MYKKLFLFLFIAFLIPIIAVWLQMIVGNPIVKFVFYGIEAAAPSLAAITMMVKDREIKIFLQENLKKKTVIKAVFLPIMIVIVTMLVAKGIVCLLYKTPFMLGNIPVTQIVIILWALIAEEIGWRGYLQPMLTKLMKHQNLVPMVVGGIWCLWHYHYFLFGEMQVPLWWFALGCIAESYIYCYLLRWTDNNLVSAMIYHSSWNLFIHIFALNPVDNMGNPSAYITLVILEIIMVLFFFFSNKKLFYNRNQTTR